MFGVDESGNDILSSQFAKGRRSEGMTVAQEANFALQKAVMEWKAFLRTNLSFLERIRDELLKLGLPLDEKNFDAFIAVKAVCIAERLEAERAGIVSQASILRRGI